jgi:hypothetical protein
VPASPSMRKRKNNVRPENHFAWHEKIATFDRWEGAKNFLWK